MTVVVAILLNQLKSAPSGEVGKATSGTYIAFGDSVAAGVGLEDYSDSSACDRTEQAYPKLVATSLNYKLETVACSGASTRNGLVGKQEVNKLRLPSQMDALIPNNRPTVISMTIGANDTNWISLIQKCYTAVCGVASDTADVKAGILAMSTNLGNALARIETTYADHVPMVVMTGYYRLFSTQLARDCTETAGIDTNELAWINDLQDTIDTSLASVAAKYSSVRYTSLLFAGHELCSLNPWIQGIDDKAPFHPTADGQRQIAKQVIKTIESTRNEK